MKKILAIICILAIFTTTTYAYSDVTEGQWYSDAVNQLTSLNILTGVENDKFEPTKLVSKSSFVAMTVRMLNLEFEDTSSNYWATGYMQAAFKGGLISEEKYSLEDWEKPISRFEVANIIYNVMTQYKNTEPKDSSLMLNSIPDKNIPDEYKNSVYQCYLWGIIRGNASNAFNGWNALTRAESAVILQRVIDENHRNPFIPQDFGKVMGEKTTYTTDNVNRNFNINKVAEVINGTILQPGEQFSYYKAIGNPGKAEGYKLAKVISGGKYVDGYGGGVCQDATTLFNAVLYSNLQIDERHAHGLKSSYVDPGYDATFASGSLDFKFTNSYNFPIKIAASFDPSTRALCFQILGPSTFTKPNLKVYTKGSGRSWTLYREVDGVVNYKTSSKYK